MVKIKKNYVHQKTVLIQQNDTFKKRIIMLNQKLDKDHIQIIVDDLNKRIEKETWSVTHNEKRMVGTYLKMLSHGKFGAVMNIPVPGGRREGQMELIQIPNQINANDHQEPCTRHKKRLQQVANNWLEKTPNHSRLFSKYFSRHFK